MADSTSDENKSPQPHTSAISEESQSPNPRSGLIAISQKSRGTESDVDDLTQELKRRPVSIYNYMYNNLMCILIDNKLR